ncbi:MAG: sodium-dependent transporter, partial [Clostridia bacterium]|nr:sodium-dependent transporter [Clostridia bacterium]
FITLPKIFDSIPGGNFIGAAFFVMVLFAALTSAISLMETIVSIFQDKLKLKRLPACLTVLVICLLLGIPSSLGYSEWSDLKIIGLQVLDFFDFISNSILMPIVAFATCLFVGFFLKPKAISDEVKLEGNKFNQEKLFSVMIRFIAPICIVLILASSVLEVLGFIKI